MNENLEKIILSSGIPVYFQNVESDCAATYWWVHVGSADETPEQAGYAHFLEHMLFKDTAAKETGTPSHGEIARRIESYGGEINAYTSYDQTVYHVTCAAMHWEKVLKTFLLMAKPQVFLQQDFDREKEVILEEYRKNQDSPSRQLFELLFAQAFQSHPYGKSIIGNLNTLHAASIQSLTAFYHEHYVANNMGLILVGPLKNHQKQILELLEESFGKNVYQPFKNHSIPLRPVEPEHQEKPSWIVHPFHVQSPTMVLSFRIPEITHTDIPALDILINILGLGEISRLYQALFYQHSLVVDVSAGNYVPKDPGIMYISADLEKIDHVIPALKEIFYQLEELKKHPPSEEEIQRVITNIESEKIYSAQTVDGHASRLGFVHFITKDSFFDLTYLQRLHAVTPQTLCTIAQKYFQATRCNGVVLIPKEQTFDAQQLVTLTEQELKNSTVPFKQKSFKNVTHQTVLSNGIKTHFTPRKSKLFSVHVSLLGGTRLEQYTDFPSGVSNLLSYCWPKGTKTKDPYAVMHLVESKAGSFDGFSGKNSVGLQMQGLAKDWECLSELLLETMVAPCFDEKEIFQAKRTITDSIQTLVERSGAYCSQLFLESLFHAHPYGRSVYGTLASLETLQQEHLFNLYSAWICPQNMVVSISGDITDSQLQKWFDLLEASFQKKSAPIALTQKPFDPVIEQPIYIEKQFQREQTHIIVGSLGLSMHDPNTYALSVLQNVLGGQSGRLFVELREKKSLAYSVGPLRFDGIERGYVGTYIACAPEKKQSAIEGIQKVLEKLASHGPSQEEVRRAQEYYLGKYVMELQSDNALAMHYGFELLYNLPQLQLEELSEKIYAVSPQQIQECCQKLYVDQKMVTAIVG